MHKFKFIDLFAGAGGLSEGFVQAGFIPVAHVEWDKAACFTLKTRAAYYYLKSKNELSHYHSYIKGKISRAQLYAHIPENILKGIINAKIGEKDNPAIFKTIDDILDGDKVDLIIGGPPCQAYSVIGRAALKHKADDERTKLYIQYGRFLKRYQPKAFIFENVPGLLSAEDGRYFKNLQKYYKQLGYEVEAKLLNAHDFGVVQYRRRVIIVGWKKKLGLSYPEFNFSKKKYYLEDIFSDLPSIKPGEANKTCLYSKPTNAYLKKTKIRNGGQYVSQHVTRPHNQRDLNIYKLAIKYLKQGNRLKNNQIPVKMRTQENTTDFLDRFKVVGEIPHTVIAHIAKDGHHFIHPDIRQLRSISIREAARIQSFPDDYYFEGPTEVLARSPAFRQIGNAVPPLMAEKIAKKIKGTLL